MQASTSFRPSVWGIVRPLNGPTVLLQVPAELRCACMVEADVPKDCFLIPAPGPLFEALIETAKQLAPSRRLDHVILVRP
jgi:hypothetical protein